jgi:hypothetical protein
MHVHHRVVQQGINKWRYNMCKTSIQRRKVTYLRRILGRSLSRWRSRLRGGSAGFAIVNFDICTIRDQRTSNLVHLNLCAAKNFEVFCGDRNGSQIDGVSTCSNPTQGCIAEFLGMLPKADPMADHLHTPEFPNVNKSLPETPLSRNRGAKWPKSREPRSLSTSATDQLSTTLAMIARLVTNYENLRLLVSNSGLCNHSLSERMLAKIFMWSLVHHSLTATNCDCLIYKYAARGLHSVLIVLLSFVQAFLASKSEK